MSNSTALVSGTSGGGGTEGSGSSNEDIALFTSAAAEQVGTMMGEDIRSYMQSMEQIYVMATAKALALIADTATEPTGIALLTQIGKPQAASVSLRHQQPQSQQPI